MPIPPHLLRIIPGVGLALTGVYVGWKIYEHHLQKQEQVQAQRVKTLEDHDDNDDERTHLMDDEFDRTQFCEWLGLQDCHALDAVPSNKFSLVVEALSLVPPPARVAFLQVYMERFTDNNNNNNDDDNDYSFFEEWMPLLERLEDTETEQIVMLWTQLPSLSQWQILHRALCLLVLQENGNGGDCKVFLNALYVLWNLENLDFYLTQLGRKQQTTHNDDESWLKVLQVTCDIVTEDPGSIELFVMTWKRLVHHHHQDTTTTMLADNEDHYRVDGYMTSLRVAHNSKNLSETRLLSKLMTLPQQRLEQVMLCCHKFQTPQVAKLLETLTATASSSPQDFSNKMNNNDSQQLQEQQQEDNSTLTSSSASSSVASLTTERHDHQQETESIAANSTSNNSGGAFSFVSTTTTPHDKQD